MIIGITRPIGNGKDSVTGMLAVTGTNTLRHEATLAYSLTSPDMQWLQRLEAPAYHAGARRAGPDGGHRRDADIADQLTAPFMRQNTSSTLAPNWELNYE